MFFQQINNFPYHKTFMQTKAVYLIYYIFDTLKHGLAIRVLYFSMLFEEIFKFSFVKVLSIFRKYTMGRTAKKFGNESECYFGAK